MSILKSKTHIKSPFEIVQIMNVPVIATGGKDDKSIPETIMAGANAISYTPPSSAELFKDSMARYRSGLPHE